MKWLNVLFVNKLVYEMVKCSVCKQTANEMVKCFLCKQTCIWNG